LVAADYGDATTRKRLFVIARRNNQPEWPEPTHSPDGTGDTEEWRTAADIIDWSEAGDSIWGRSRPLVSNTMERIAEGIRRHADDALEPFADVVAALGKEDVEAMQERMIPPEYAHLAAQVLDEPFLIGAPDDDSGGHLSPVLSGATLPKYYGTATAKPTDEPLDTVTAGGQKHALCSFVLGQHSNSVARDVTERPVPTVTTDGNIQLVNSAPFVLGQHGGATARKVDTPLPTVASDGYIRLFDVDSMVLPANGYYRGLHSNPAFAPEEKPLNTVKAQNTTGHLLSVGLLRYSHGGASLSIDDPLPTITTAKGGVFGLSSAYLVPYYSERAGQAPRTHAIDSPCPTVTATGSNPYLSWPFIIQYHGTSGPQPIDEPTPTIETRDSLALCIPEFYPWGLDIRFRMLQPRELAAAQGFPEDYDFVGTKTDTVEQIGNAVPINLGKALVGSLLTSETPSLTDFLDDSIGIPTTSDDENLGPSSAASDD
jgi:DNA (cytosine-5)-methyltransferase 1